MHASRQADRQAGRDSAYFILLFCVLIYFSYRFIISDVPLTHSFWQYVFQVLTTSIHTHSPAKEITEQWAPETMTSQK